MSSPNTPKGSVTDIMDFVVAQAKSITDVPVEVTRKMHGVGNSLVRQGGTLSINRKQYRVNVREDTSRPSRVTQETKPDKLKAAHANSAALLALGNVDALAAKTGKYARLPQAETKSTSEIEAVRRSIEVLQPNSKRLQFHQVVDGNGGVDFVSKGNEPQSFGQWLKAEAEASLTSGHRHGLGVTAQATIPR